jgi:hypothetical protein
MRRKRRRPLCLNCGKEVLRPSHLYCNNDCQHERHFKLYIERWKAGLETGNTGRNATFVSKHVRRYLTEKYGERCQLCGWDKRHPITHRVPLAVEHKDGNWRNLVEENLTLLCPNCHSLTLTYGSLRQRPRLQESGSSSAVERELPKLDVAGSIPVSRSRISGQLSVVRIPVSSFRRTADPSRTEVRSR